MLQKKYSESEKCYKKSLEINKKEFGEYHLFTANSLKNLGYLYEKKGIEEIGDYKKKEIFEISIKYYNEFLKIYKKLSKKDELIVGKIYGDLGFMNFYCFNYDESEKYYKESINICKKNSTVIYYFNIQLYEGIGILYQKKKEYKKAVENYEKSLDIKLLYLKGDSFEYNYQELTNYGHTFKKLEEYSIADDYYMKALNLAKGISSKKMILSYEDLGDMYSEKADYEKNFTEENDKKYRKALIYYNKTLDLYKSIYGDDCEELIKAYENLGYIHYYIKNFKEHIKYSNLEQKLRKKYNNNKYYKNLKYTEYDPYEILGYPYPEY